MKIDTITDNHMHLDPLNGMGLEAAKRFQRAGGTCLFLVNKMSGDYGIQVRGAGDFEAVFDRTIALKERISRETGLTVFAVVGVHPAEFAGLCKDRGVEEALEISKKAVELAGERVAEGRATALGEMGRPHFEVEAEVFEASNLLLEHAMAVARDVGCAIQIHAESSSEALFEDLSRMAKKTGLNPEKVVKHFSGPQVALAETYGIMPSVLSAYENIRAAIGEGMRFLMESDYIDDNRRPGAVLGPKNVPRTTLKLVEEALITAEDAAKIHRDNVEETYGVE
ncbi:MAG: metal-dependent hydrolase, partial [Methanobacteriota archaeon]